MNSTKPSAREDIIDGFAILSFGYLEDLENFLQNNKDNPSSTTHNFKEAGGKIETKYRKQHILPSPSLPTPPKYSVKIEETITKDDIDDSSSDATVEDNLEDRMLDNFMDASEAAASTSASDEVQANLNSIESKVAIKRPADEILPPHEIINHKRPHWDGGGMEMKPNLETLCRAVSQSAIQVGTDLNQSKSSLKKEVEDEEALIEGMTKKEVSINNYSASSSDVKPVVKPESEALENTKYVKQNAMKVDVASVKKESTPLRRRSPTPDDVVVVLDDSSSHSSGASWHRWFPGLIFEDGKQLKNDSLLAGCARTDVRYDASRIKHRHKNFIADKKQTCQSSGRRTSSIGPLSSSSSINSSKTGFSPRRSKAESPRSSDRLPPFRPPAFVPPRLTSPLHTTGGFCLPMPTVVPPAGLGVTMPPQQTSMMMPGWGQFELLAAQMAANQEMLRVQQGLNDRFLQDGNVGLRTVPLIGTGINIPMAIPGLQPTLTLRTEMHQHQHLHHHQHVVPASPYAPLPTVPPPVHPIQTQMAPPMYFQPSANIFSSYSRPGPTSRGAFMPMADHRSNPLPASQLLAKFRDRDWKQSSSAGRPGFKGRWCSAHVQLAWRILSHCRDMKRQADDSSYMLKINNMKSADSAAAFKPSPGKMGSPLHQLRPSGGWMGLKTERSSQEVTDPRIIEFGRKERETVLRLNSGRTQDDFTYPSHLPPHFLHQPPLNFAEKKDFLGLDGSMNAFNRSACPSNDPPFYMSNKGPLNPFTSPLPQFLPIGDDLNMSYRGQERKLMNDKYQSSSAKDVRLPSPDTHRHNRTPSNSSLNSFPFFPPPPSNSLQHSLHMSGRYGPSGVPKTAGKPEFGSRQDLPLGFPGFHNGGFNKTPYPTPDIMSGGLLPTMLDPASVSRSPFLKHPDSRLAPSPSQHNSLWSSYVPGVYPASKQDPNQAKGLSVPPLLPPFR